MTSPSNIHGESSSSVDEIFEDNRSADVADRGGLIQRGSHAPPVCVRLVKGVAAAVAGIDTRGGDDEVVSGCLSDEVDMERLF